ncbi:LytTR family DNA-binding domain-containing protein [Methylopila henanensis]|uniref:LytTR family DNA-binding domain-containing protein n=1 Tax=Methylopila henanensis TaxID=873516 RepID=A0ABW4K393_9HYPH
MRDFANFQAEPWLRQRVGELGVALGLGLVFAYIGPFTTDEPDFLSKLGYWTGLLACWFIVAALVEQALRNIDAYRSAGVWIRRICLVAVASAPMLAVVAPATTALVGWEASVPELIEMYGQIALICLGVVILSDGILGAPRTAVAGYDGGAGGTMRALPPPAVAGGDATVAAPPAASTLLARLPPDLRGPIVCLEMEDHYVRVHTSRGSSLVLMRLGDAMRELGPTPGAQAHRSWWVAAAAIESFERSGRAGRLTLSNGLTAPVSQRHLRAIAELAQDRASPS